jgi:hypothetical protein
MSATVAATPRPPSIITVAITSSTSTTTACTTNTSTTFGAAVALKTTLTPTTVMENKNKGKDHDNDDDDAVTSTFMIMTIYGAVLMKVLVLNNHYILLLVPSLSWTISFSKFMTIITIILFVWLSQSSTVLSLKQICYKDFNPCPRS